MRALYHSNLIQDLIKTQNFTISKINTKKVENCKSKNLHGPRVLIESYNCLFQFVNKIQSRDI